ncbi:uncharacterized protein LOC121343515 [Onychostruthus taczanowskii]|uniref:uncharacterized protein LOC121343515 n=1 Tax=Onychostruthus taczanowskii TaxID=356909 RepID=UPI001B80755C|nr:uncharacterized protein LOC121343515 [Onychostruthus taczanowskii]
MRWDGMGWERLGAGRPPQAGLRERERLPGRRHHGNALPPWRGEPFASPPPRSYFTAVRDPGEAGRDAQGPANRGAPCGTGGERRGRSGGRARASRAAKRRPPDRKFGGDERR